MEQHLHRLETEARHQRDQIAASRAAVESLRGRLRVIEAGGLGGLGRWRRPDRPLTTEAV